MSALSGRAVLVTRPAHQAENLVALLATESAEPVRFPTLAIEPIDGDAFDTGSIDIAVFTSANAVRHGLPVVAAAGGFAANARLAAIGRGTTEALRREGHVDVLMPAEGADSESLLAVPALTDVAGQRVAILTGAGGRTLLADALRARGAEVRVLPVYRRVRPSIDPAPLHDRLERGALHAVTISSAEGLANLFAMVDAQAGRLLLRLPHIVTHTRIAEAARARAISTVVVAGPGDVDVVAALTQHFSAPDRRRVVAGAHGIKAH